VEATYLMADRVAPVSHYCRLWELESGADDAKIHPVHNGIDQDRFPFDPAEPDAPVLVFVGRIDPLKDIETLLRSFALVREAVPGARLRMFGPRTHAAYARRVDDLAVELELGSSAVFEGPVDAPAVAYHAGQVVLLTSISEGFPFAVLEAMACGRPVIATDVGGVAEAVADSGLMVPPRDPAAVARAAIELLGDPERRRSLGRRARDRVLEHFTLEQCIANYRDLYRDLMHPRRPVELEEALGDGAAAPTSTGPRTIDRADLPLTVPVP
jgi:glycosyltransferase involved in cell wall biosynthesis